MKRAFKSGLLALSLAMGSWAIPVAAQDGAGRPERPGRAGRGPGTAAIDPSRLKAVVEDLKLTGETKTKADEIIAKAVADMRKTMAEGGENPRAGAANAAAIVKAAEEDIAAVLDEDQKLMFQSKLKAAAATAQAGPGGPGAGPGGPGGGGRPLMIGQRIKEATASLTLTDEQKTTVDALVGELQKKTEELRAAGPSPEMREKLQAMREEGQTKIKAILTEEQYAKFEAAMRQPPAGARPGAAGGGRLGGAIARFEEAVGGIELTEEQKPKIKAAFDSAKKKLEELAPQLQGGPTPELRALLETLRTELGAVLTPEQREKLRAALPQGAGGGAAGRRPGAEPAQPEKKPEQK